MLTSGTHMFETIVLTIAELPAHSTTLLLSRRALIRHSPSSKLQLDLVRPPPWHIS